MLNRFLEAKMDLYKDRNWLMSKYVDEELSTIEIAEICNIKPSGTIHYWLKKFNIKTRNLSEALGTSRCKMARSKARKEWLKNNDTPSFERTEKWRKNISKALKGRRREKNPIWNSNLRKQNNYGYVMVHAPKDYPLNKNGHTRLVLEPCR